MAAAAAGQRSDMAMWGCVQGSELEALEPGDLGFTDGLENVILRDVAPSRDVWTVALEFLFEDLALTPRTAGESAQEDLMQQGCLHQTAHQQHHQQLVLQPQPLPQFQQQVPLPALQPALQQQGHWQSSGPDRCVQEELRRCLEMDAWQSQEEALTKQQLEMQQLRRRAEEAERLHQEAQELRQKAEADRLEAEAARREAEDLWRRVEETRRPEETLGFVSAAAASCRTTKKPTDFEPGAALGDDPGEAPAAPGGVFMKFKRPPKGQRANSSHSYEAMVVESAEDSAVGPASREDAIAGVPGPRPAEEQGGLFSSAKSLLSASKAPQEQGAVSSDAQRGVSDAPKEGNDDRGSLPLDAGGSSLLPGARDETIAGLDSLANDDSLPLLGPQARAPFRTPRPAGRPKADAATSVAPANDDFATLDGEPSLLGPTARKQFKRPRISAPSAASKGRAAVAALPNAAEAAGQDMPTAGLSHCMETVEGSCALANACSGGGLMATASEGLATAAGGAAGGGNMGSLQRTTSIGFL
mmetsp:Transcript_96537/g.282163  ORF Transcript_96537/g.282163 Transcript_96537/m.282163 type:complete len:529 (-) Transcript_96537:51-1637(-)